MIDLGSSPPSNSYLTQETLSGPETWYPLRVLVCEACWLAQTEDFASRAELFNENYAYFSSFSESWLNHARCYVDAMVKRFDLMPHSLVVEVASNDGYLLQFVKERGIRTLGVEPTRSTAEAACARGIETVQDFFGVDLARRLARDGVRGNLMVANNVLAHVPDINDFVAGFATLLAPDGVATFEFPHLLQLLAENQFDTVYHEHYSYLSLTAVQRVFAASGLSVFDVDKIATHGGSLRVFAQRSDIDEQPISPRVQQVLNAEQAAGMNSPQPYLALQRKAENIADDFVDFLVKAKRDGKEVGGYGAAAKGNTLLNFAGVREHLLAWVADRNPAKAGKFIPGMRIPIVSEEHLRNAKPDYVVILPWNLTDEVTQQLGYIREWGGQFVRAVPKLVIS